MRKLVLSDSLSLPLDTVTQTLAIVAKRRMGKSYLGRKLAEELFECGQQVVILDPKGDHWGIRSAANGKGPGLSIVILGGEHGDVPLEVGSGEVVAKFVVEEAGSVLLDLSAFRKHEVATFSTAFLENLYRLKAREQYRTPMMLIIDEADAIAPQRPQKGEERMLGAAEDIVRRGGQRGIGVTLITQRTAVLNKNVLTQAQVLIALRTIAPQDLDAMNAWIDVHGTEDERRKLMETLPALPQGDAWVWSPGWPTSEGIFQRIHVAPIKTFDSGSTPKPGEKRIHPKHLADVDLNALRKQMADTMERAKADDPRELHKEITALKKQLSQVPAPKVETKIEQVAVISDYELQRLGEIARELVSVGDRIASALLLRTGNATSKPAIPARRTIHTPVVATPKPKEAVAAGTGSLGKGERAILSVLAQYKHGKPRRAIGTLSGYSSNGGSFGTYISRLRTKGLIVGNDPIRITEEGLEALGEFEVLPKGDELQAYWLSRLGKGERAILQVLLASYPAEIDRQNLGERAGYESRGGSFGTYLSRLRTKELIHPDRLVASEAFFE